MRREWLVRIALALGVLLLLAWVAQNSDWVEETVPGLRQGEALYDDKYALRKLVGLLGGTLSAATPADPLPSPGGVLVLANWTWNIAPARDAQLRRWVQDGGRLVVQQEVAESDAFAEWTGIHAERPKRPAKPGAAGAQDADDAGTDEAGSDEAGTDETSTEEAGAGKGVADKDATGAKSAGPDDRLASKGCLALRLIRGETPSDPDATLWRLCDVGTGFSWRSARPAQLALGTRDGPQLLRLGMGRGSVTVLQGYGHFGTANLLDGDHARLFVIAAQLRRGDAVQVLDGGERSSLLAWLWRSGAPLVLSAVALVALGLWGLMQRFGPLEPAPPLARRSLRSQVAGSAAFLARHGGQQALWLSSWRALRAGASRMLSQEEAAEPARLAEALARRGYLDAAALRRALVHPDLRTPAGLAEALAAIERARRQVGNARLPTDPSRGSA